jgi:predicted ATPase
MPKIIISGGPHTGKTTLFNSLEQKYGGEAAFVSEPATTVIKNLGGTAIVSNPAEFCRQCIDVSILQESLASEKSSIVIQDRSLVDTVAYARRDGCDDLIPRLWHLIGLAEYSQVLFREPVGSYLNTYERYEDEETAQRTHGMLLTAYHEAGIPLVDVPAASVSERVNIASYYIDGAIAR